MQEHLEYYGLLHTDPHGIEFADPKLTEAQQLSNVANVELVIRLWNQFEHDDPPHQPSRIRPRILPVPKLLAIFLEGRRTEMHKDESIAQALLLLQTYVVFKAS